MTKLPILSALVLAAALTACSRTDSPAELTAVLDSPFNATLTWTTTDARAAGRAVEFATEPGGEYTTLQYTPVERTTYRHPDLIPDTNFHYRVRTYSGPTSESREITLPPGELDDATQAEDHGWITPKTVPGTVADVSALRAGGGAPTDLQATVEHANGIRFTWTDHATDEDGYLLEVKAAGATTFTPAAVLDPNTNSAGLITLPDEKTAAYRVRAFFWGGTSNVAHVKTGPDPDGH
ncbi:fibronectin type III domain-containing protein [Umezawaea endophytica]|uniref:Fibronectin type III domain-containing protein n=1 Tax=Umezawaea endophytica TaxID=1654476 RepID=A0A9X2VNE9_9PSEU|nr:fibronectin type III domain-containing protein [Umezawaea endophytica]MCS7479334.1 fibronectin type III domain-containing protein [Umezawaea endophytica]